MAVIGGGGAGGGGENDGMGGSDGHGAGGCLAEAKSADRRTGVSVMLDMGRHAATTAAVGRELLARRGCVDGVEAGPVKPPLIGCCTEELKRVRLDEPERVVRLRRNVHADHLEPGAVVAHRRAARATE